MPINQSGALPFSVALRELPYMVTLFTELPNTVSFVFSNPLFPFLEKKNMQRLDIQKYYADKKFQIPLMVF